MLYTGSYRLYFMHSLETGIIVSIAAFFFLTFFTFVFTRETNISKEINTKVVNEINVYKENAERGYSPEIINQIIDILIEGGNENVGEN